MRTALQPCGLLAEEQRHEESMEQLVPITRRLVAVVFADVVGWSRLIEQNDVQTLHAWKSLRADLIEPKIHEHGGHLLEIAGDAVLVQFPSAVGAVAWALDTQRGLAHREQEGHAPQLSLRIGINVEDVIVDEGRMIGDGVNIAARILPIAAPGEVVVTSTVRDYIWNKMPVTFGDLGERELRNISRPIRVFRVDAQDPGVGIPVRSQPHLSWTRRPAVAVLPFRNLGGKPEEGYFGEGITEDIIRELSRSHSLYVIAWNSTLRYRDRPVAAREVASELGVRYILEGSVRRQASRLRISTELIDVTGSQTVWADKFDGADNDIFEFQDRIASSIVGTLEPKLYQVEAVRALGKPTERLDAYECVLRALSLLYTFNDRDFAEAGKYFERAVSLDPLYAQAHAYLAWWLNLLRGEGRSSDPAGDAGKAVRAATTAVELDPDDAFCLAVAGHVEGFLHKNLDIAVDLFDRALRQNENCAFAWGISGSTYCFLGRPDEALERLRNAWRLSPFDPLNFFFCTVAGIAEFIAGRYDQSIGWLRKAQRMNPRFVACHRTLTASLALSGDVGGATAAAENLLSIDPRFRVSTFVSWYPLRRRDDLERLATGLRRAGLPE
jgi:adenylate cyclase